LTLVLVAGTDEVLAHPGLGEAPMAMLTAAEAERAHRFRFDADRRDFVAAHILLRLTAARVLGTGAAELTVVQHCGSCGGPHGRPWLAGYPGTYLSLAHTRGAVVAAAGPGPVGVDVERTDRRGPGAEPALLARTMTPAEGAEIMADPDPSLAFLRLWVRKESLVKVGATTLGDLDQLDLSPLGVGPAPGPLRFGDWHLLDWSRESRHLVGAAVADRPVHVEHLAG
jgi:4'-phosphopantetheinyl transferase